MSGMAKPENDVSRALKKVLEIHSQKEKLLTPKERYFKHKSENTRVEIPISAFDCINKFGRKKYRVIIIMATLSLLWDGWKNKRTGKTKRKPKNDVLFTRRMGAEWFGFSEATTSRALNDMIKNDMIKIHNQGMYSSKQGKSLGSTYTLSWLPPKKGNERIWLYWALFTSEAFQSLTEAAQAVLILLHVSHHRNSNRINIKTTTLQQYGVNRNQLSLYIKELMQADLIEYIDINTYRFTWMEAKGKLSIDRLSKKNYPPVTDTQPAIN